MSWPFDPAKARALLAEQIDGKWRAKQAMRAFGWAAANYAVEAHLAGVPEAAPELATIAIKWMETAPLPNPNYEDRDYATYCKHGEQASRLQHLAVAHWIVSGTVRRDVLSRALDEMDLSHTAYRAWSKARMDKLTLDIYVAMAVLAHEYARAHQCFAQEDADAGKPLVPAKARSERKVGAIIASLRQKGEEVDRATLDALDRLLKLQIPKWFYSISYSQFAVWLLIRDEARGLARSPSEVIADAFHFMPEVSASRG